MGTGRRHSARIVVCLAAALTLAALATPAPAAKPGPGALDRSFSGDGKVITEFPDPRGSSHPNYVLPFEFAPGRIAMAGGPNGSLVAANSQAIVRFLANGRRDPRFGGNGSVPIAGTEGFRFQLADVAVDSQGRVLVAGTTRATNNVGMEGQPVAGPLPSIGTIHRYTAGGQLDATFGAGGVLHSFFGAPAATFEGAAYDEPAVSLVGLAVDGQDRPIVTGTAVVEVGRCGSSEARYQRSQGFVSRRAAVGGGPDPSFAGVGSAAIGNLAWLALPVPTRGGLFAVGEAEDPCRSGGAEQPSAVAGMGDAGLLPSFSGDGFWSRPFTRVSDIAAAPKGKIVLLTRTIELRRGRFVESPGKAVRLRANGAVDRRFGKGGEARVRLPERSSLAALAVDRKGRVLLAGTVVHRVRDRKKARQNRSHQTRQEILLIRVSDEGEVDRGFGRRGRTTTSFGAKGDVLATEVLVDRANRISVGGKYAGGSGDNAFAIARYLGGR